MRASVFQVHAGEPASRYLRGLEGAELTRASKAQTLGAADARCTPAATPDDSLCTRKALKPVEPDTLFIETS